MGSNLVYPAATWGANGGQMQLLELICLPNSTVCGEYSAVI